MDPGAPISYQVLEPGTPVYSSDGEMIGTVAHVLAVEAEDVFDGIVITERVDGDERRNRGEHRFADADVVAALHEHAVTLRLDAAACRQLPEPSQNPAVMRDDPAAAESGAVQSKLRRAWDLISGNY
jgi:hypothetical protein